MIRSRLAPVDRFVAPSRFLADLYVEWGLPREKLLVQDYGRDAVEPLPAEPRDRRDRLGFFGQLTPYKGADVLLEAIAMLARRGELGSTTLQIHGANLKHQPTVYRRRLEQLLAQAGGAVTFEGRYTREELRTRMAAVDWVVVPSIWWENSPLVIQEAFAYGRPVICSDIGGMAEKVSHGVDGLHFPVRDPAALANLIAKATRDVALWTRLSKAAKPPRSMRMHIDMLLQEYDRLRSARPSAPQRGRFQPQAPALGRVELMRVEPSLTYVRWSAPPPGVARAALATEEGTRFEVGRLVRLGPSPTCAPVLAAFVVHAAEAVFCRLELEYEGGVAACVDVSRFDAEQPRIRRTILSDVALVPTGVDPGAWAGRAVRVLQRRGWDEAVLHVEDIGPQPEQPALSIVLLAGDEGATQTLLVELMALAARRDVEVLIVAATPMVARDVRATAELYETPLRVVTSTTDGGAWMSAGFAAKAARAHWIAIPEGLGEHLAAWSEQLLKLDALGAEISDAVASLSIPDACIVRSRNLASLPAAAFERTTLPGESARRAGAQSVAHLKDGSLPLHHVGARLYEEWLTRASSDAAPL